MVRTIALSIIIILLVGLIDCKTLEVDHLKIQIFDLIRDAVEKINLLTFGNDINKREEINIILDVFKIMKTISHSNNNTVNRLLTKSLILAIKIRRNSAQ